MIRSDSTIRLQKICLSIMLLVMIPFLFLVSQKYYVTDPQPTIYYLLPKNISANNPPVKIMTGLTISGFSQFDPRQNIFEFNGTIWFEFNPKEISSDTVEKFSFYNGKINEKLPLDTVIIGNNLRIFYSIVVEVTTQLNFHFFPLEDHQLFFVLKNEYVSPNEVEYIARTLDFLVSPESIHQGEWSIIDNLADAGYSGPIGPGTENSIMQLADTVNPEAVFALKIKKNHAGFIFTFLLPLMALFIISLLMLSYADTVKNSLSTIGALIAYKFIITSMAPKVSYFTFVDYLYTLTFCTTFFILCLTLIDDWTEKKSAIIARIAMFSIPIFYSVWISIWVFLVFFYQSKGFTL